MNPTDITITRLVHAVMLIMGRQGEYKKLSLELMNSAALSGHLSVPDRDGPGLAAMVEEITEAVKRGDYL